MKPAGGFGSWRVEQSFLGLEPFYYSPFAFYSAFQLFLCVFEFCNFEILVASSTTSPVNLCLAHVVIRFHKTEHRQPAATNLWLNVFRVTCHGKEFEAQSGRKEGTVGIPWLLWGLFPDGKSSNLLWQSPNQPQMAQYCSGVSPMKHIPIRNNTQSLYMTDYSVMNL